MAYSKITWVNGSTQVNATNMNHIEQGIYNNSVNTGELSNLDTTVKTDLVSAVNEVKSSIVPFVDTYSTNEIQTNKVWVDNKPIYRKVVSVNFPSSGTSASTAHSISNLSMVTSVELIWYDVTDAKWYQTFKDTTGDYYIEVDGINSSYVFVKTGTSYNWQNRTRDRYAIIEYTKSTD